MARSVTALDLLRRGHKQVLTLLKQFGKVDAQDEQRDLCEQMVSELTAHTETPDRRREGRVPSHSCSQRRCTSTIVTTTSGVPNTTPNGPNSAPATMTPPSASAGGSATAQR